MSERPVSVTLRVDMAGFARAAEKAARSMHHLSLALMRPGQRRRHARRCAICSPTANPRPLGINGHAYRQRSKNRRSR